MLSHEISLRRAEKPDCNSFPPGSNPTNKPTIIIFSHTSDYPRKQTIRDPPSCKKERRYGRFEAIPCTAKAYSSLQKLRSMCFLYRSIAPRRWQPLNQLDEILRTSRCSTRLSTGKALIQWVDRNGTYVSICPHPLPP
jgi:hypothetical protein